jgi:hypothetical protein
MKPGKGFSLLRMERGTQPPERQGVPSGVLLPVIPDDADCSSL